jgi:hypothetical protein
MDIAAGDGVADAEQVELSIRIPHLDRIFLADQRLVIDRAKIGKVPCSTTT